ncbi:MAG: GMC family oxidoreductase N-terminal domain-containing protein [Chloroflexi bacterium]|nr:GMC family oxidoreductase N-terminal domain-containing protein [Chloroflexota bacterium]
MPARELPASADIVVVGGGTSGAALAGILARQSDASVVLVEAGPDYGPFDAHAWPAELLDARQIPGTHSWDYSGLAHPTHTNLTPFDRARVLGGCSAHNGCVALSGHRRDYDLWAELGNAGWDWESVGPAFARARTALRVRQVDPDDVSPYHGAFADAATAAGLARTPDLDNPDGVSEVGFSPVNIRDGVRWNAAFGYLDPVRARPNLQIVERALVDRVELDGDRAVAIHALTDVGTSIRIQAQRVVLSAGAYASPAILMRSGIGAPDALRALDITPLHPLPGVGASLQDHPTVGIMLRPTDELTRRMDAWSRERWLSDEQALGKARSRVCDEAFDLHVISYTPRETGGTERTFQIWAANVAPRSTGTVRLASKDPTAAPLIDHGFLSDPDGHDAEVLHDGFLLAREIAASGKLQEVASVNEPELELIPPGGDARAVMVPRIAHYYHPSCSCRMGPSRDKLAVVDAEGRVHGLRGLYVCDASIYPRLMRANTNLPSAMLAEHLAPAIGRS